MPIQPLVHQEPQNGLSHGPDEELPHPEYPQGETENSTAIPLQFDDLYDAWFDEVSKWIRAMGGPAADRDDLVQEVFIVVYRRLKDFDGQNLAGWLYQIARHKVRDFRRLRWAKRLVLLDNEPRAPEEHSESNPQTSLETREKRELLLRLLDELNEGERAAIVLFEIEGYSGQKIAELQSVPVNTVWTRIHKARQKLSQRLDSLERTIRKRRVT